MKRLTALSTLFALAAVGVHANTESQIVELPITKVFIPAKGFDDNDSIEAVVDGNLPNACYVLEKQLVNVDTEKKVITIRQMAIRQSAGTCKEGSEPNTPELITPIPFTETVKIGQLPSGDYQIQYSSQAGQTIARSFAVEHAPAPTLDSVPYAMVTEISTSDVLYLGQELKLQVTGILNNSCYQLNETVAFEKIDDVFVVLPTVKVDRQGACLMYTRPYTVGVNLGRVMEPNRYLIHVRSMNGGSLNRVFSAMRQPR